MPRRARIILCDVPIHVVQRGNNRSACFVHEEDRSFYLFHLGRNLARFNCELHAYCLMTNHVHLLLTPKELDSCGLLMKHVGQLHSQYMNRRYERSGTLWEGRFRSCIVQSEDYLLSCYRYIELNPVRAGLAGNPGEYPWSSYLINAEDSPWGIITPHEEYLRLGEAEQTRKQRYRELLEIGLSVQRLEEIRAATNGGFALGSQIFKRALSNATGRRVEGGSPADVRPRRGNSTVSPICSGLRPPKRGLSLIRVAS